MEATESVEGLQLKKGLDYVQGQVQTFPPPPNYCHIHNFNGIHHMCCYCSSSLQAPHRIGSFHSWYHRSEEKDETSSLLIVVDISIGWHLQLLWHCTILWTIPQCPPEILGSTPPLPPWCRYRIHIILTLPVFLHPCLCLWGQTDPHPQRGGCMLDILVAKWALSLTRWCIHLGYKKWGWCKMYYQTKPILMYYYIEFACHKKNYFGDMNFSVNTHHHCCSLRRL